MLTLYLPDNKDWFQRTKTLLDDGLNRLETARKEFLNTPNTTETTDFNKLSEAHRAYLLSLAYTLGMFKACLSIAPPSHIQENLHVEEEISKVFNSILIVAPSVLTNFLSGFANVYECYDILNPNIGLDTRTFSFSKRTSKLELTPQEAQRKDNILGTAHTFMRFNFKEISE